MSSVRQLAAIMFTDIVGYTSLMGTDEQKAFSILNKNRSLQKPIVEKHHGKWIKELGDGTLVSFSTVYDAVNAAIAIQQSLKPADDFQLRIGIHLGEVVFENGDVFGDGVNVASRIQSAAEPGSIFISAKVFDEIKNRKEIQAVSMGKYYLKNVKEEVDLFAISNNGIKVPGKLKTAAQVKARCCILVLPFVNLSKDQEQEYFSDGLTEELISKLSGLSDLKVISRTTSMKYKNTNKDVKTIEEETHASYIVEGSVRKSGNNLRITAQFIDADRDTHIWSESYSGTLDDVFDIQEKVSEKIAKALKVQLSGDEQDTLRRRSTANTEAYQLYLKGRYFWNKRNEEGLKTAVRFFEKAIEADPDYGLAWAGLSDTYSLMIEYTNLPRKELQVKINETVKKALALDNNLAEAHISRAVSLTLNEWDWKTAEEEFKLGIQLSPSYATGHHWYAELLLFSGRITEAYREISLAADLDPVSQGILKDKGIFYYYNRRYDEAIDYAMKSLELDADFAPAYRLLSLAYSGKKDFDKAIEQNKKWGSITGNIVKTKITHAELTALAGRKQEAEEIASEILNGTPLSANDYRGMALVFTALEDKERAFEWLDKSYDKHEESLCSMKVDPKLDLLRPDPRFDVLLKKVGLANGS